MSGWPGDMVEAAVHVTADAAVGSHPDTARPARRDGPRRIPLQAFGLASRDELDVSQAQQSRAVTADPQAALVVLQQGAQIAVRKSGAIQCVEVPVAPADEAAATRADP